MRDLQEFIAEEESRRPGDLIRVKDPIDPNKCETIAFLKHLDDRGLEKMVLFENVTTLEGKPSPFPLFYNPWVSRQFCADGIGMGDLKSKMELSLEVSRLEKEKGDTELIPPDSAPCQEVVLKGSEADLARFPIPMHHDLDIGPYWTMACVMKGESAPFYDITFTKNLYYDGRTMSFSAHKHHHLETIVTENEAKDQRAPVIIVMGHHPAFYFSSCCMTPYGNDDYQSAAAFMREPLRLTPSVTWGEDFLVPADAEIIVEGEVPPNVRRSQNPFGEVLGYYQVTMDVPIVEVTAITHRRNAILQDIWAGQKDHWNLGGITKEGSVYNSIKRNIAGIKAIHLPPLGLRPGDLLHLHQEAVRQRAQEGGHAGLHRHAQPEALRGGGRRRGRVQRARGDVGGGHPHPLGPGPGRHPRGPELPRLARRQRRRGGRHPPPGRRVPHQERGADRGDEAGGREQVRLTRPRGNGKDQEMAKLKFYYKNT